MFYKSESLGQRGGKGGCSVNNGLTVPVLPELLGSADSPFILLPPEELAQPGLSQAPPCATSPEEAFQEYNELWAWKSHIS